MGRASTYSDVAGTPQTCCTTCRTVFEVSPELLSSADTRVRCGECLSIFDALANLRDPGDETLDADALAAADEAAASGADEETLADMSSEHGVADEADVTELADLADETGSLDVTYSDFDLFSGDAQLPEVAYLDETADTPDFDFDAVDPDEDETFSDTLFAHDATVEPTSLADERAATDGEAHDEVRDGPDGDPDDGAGRDPDGGPRTGAEPDPDYIEDEEPVEPIVFEYRDAAPRGAGVGAAEDVLDDADTRAAAPVKPATDAAVAGTAVGGAHDAPRGGRSWSLLLLLVLALGTLLAGLYAYRERGSLHNDPLARPVFLAVCKVSGCTVPSRVELSSLRLMERKVFTHPSEPSALVINVAFRNAASFDQRYPVLVVRLRDRLGRTVAERDFAPDDYLDDWKPGDTLEAGRRLDISLEVGDPGDGAESYEFEFREALA